MQNAFVYLSGPITAKCGFSVEENVASALNVYWACLLCGIPAFCPHLSATFPTAHSAIAYETWMAYDFAVIDRSTHVLMLPRWDSSSGAIREMEYAKTRGLSVVFSVSELQQALDAVDPVPGVVAPRERATADLPPPVLPGAD